MKAAALTMIYDEPEFLPIWCRYYGREFGPENCFIVDHGSDDNSTAHLDGFNVIRIPRSPKDNVKRTRFMSALSSNLLEWYDAVLHTDGDEIVVADPEAYSSILDYINQCRHKIVNAFGFDLHHVASEEEEIVLSSPILQQRKWLRFSSSMCKPVLTYRPIKWSPGFHSADSPIHFDRLYLFHLRYFDLTTALIRLQRTRSMPWSSAAAGAHQRVSNQDFADLMNRIARLPKVTGTSLQPDAAPLRDYTAAVLRSEQDYHDATYNLDLHIFGESLIEIPDRFRSAF